MPPLGAVGLLGGLLGLMICRSDMLGIVVRTSSLDVHCACVVVGGS